MSKRAVIGLGFGDEGKGVVTEYLCSQNPESTIVVRFSGGQQAAHTVHKDKINHVFSHFGSGTLSGCPTFWSEQCTINPWTLLRELKELKEKGVNPKLFIHPHCRVTTPFDMAMGQELDIENGTTGHGILRTIIRSKEVEFNAAQALLGIRVYPLNIMEKIEEYYDLEVDIGPYMEALYELRNNFLGVNVFIISHSMPPNYKNVVFEGSQGLLLDEKIGYMPHCTPTDVTPASIIHHDLDEIFILTRSYQTRHGPGPMTNMDKPVTLKNNEHETCKANRFQGELRPTVLDLDQLVYAKAKGIDILPIDTKISLVVTCMDQLDDFRVTYQGKEITCKDENEFVKLISEALKVNGDVYTNHSPYSNLRKVNA